MKVKLEDSRIYIDGEFESKYSASRRLTKTDFEEGYGIFENDSSEINFDRGVDSVTVDFGYSFDIENVERFESEVRRRVRMVKEAFRKAKVIEFDIEV